MGWKDFFGFLGFILLAIILLLPVIYCTYGFFWSEENRQQEVQQILTDSKEINIDSYSSFKEKISLNVKYGVAKVNDFTSDILARILGWRDLFGNLKCENGWKYYIIGILVSFWVFIGFLFIGYSEWSMARDNGEEVTSLLDTFWWRFNHFLGRTNFLYEVDNTNKKNSLDVLGGNWKRTIYLCLGYGFIMTFVPVINRLISIITLEFLMPNILIQSMIIAFEIGIIPALFQEYNHWKKYMKAYKKRFAYKTAQKIAEAEFNA